MTAASCSRALPVKQCAAVITPGVSPTDPSPEVAYLLSRSLTLEFVAPPVTYGFTSKLYYPRARR